MSENSQKNIPEWLIHFSELDSTNTYASSLIRDGLAQDGQLVVTNHQTKGRGQRQKSWKDDHNSVLASLILTDIPEKLTLEILNFLVPLSIIESLKTYSSNIDFKIKWPNDIYIQDKKLGGILIENTFKGSIWSSAVIGFGININQEDFPNDLLNPISLKMGTAQNHEILPIAIDIRNNICKNISLIDNEFYVDQIKDQYNDLLFLKGVPTQFLIQEKEIIEGKIIEVNDAFQLVIEDNEGTFWKMNFGEVTYKF